MQTMKNERWLIGNGKVFFFIITSESELYEAFLWGKYVKFSICGIIGVDVLCLCIV